MREIYFGSVFMAAVAYLIMALLLFLQRREGERSRLILCFFVLVSVFNYTLRIVSLMHGDRPPLVVSVPMLLLAIFMVTAYITYPIEVISPGWINLKRLFKLCIPLLLFTGVWLLSLCFGVIYKPYTTIIDMLPDIGNFDVWLRLLLCLMIFLPLLFIFFIPYTKRYNNTNRRWIWGYVTACVVNTLAYIMVLSSDNIYVDTGYYYVSVACEMYIVYQELFVRLIDKPSEKDALAEHPVVETILQPVIDYGFAVPTPDHSSISDAQEMRYGLLFGKLDALMKKEMLWRDPDLSMAVLVQRLATNRTTLALAIQEGGYDNYTDYVNRLRINEFIGLVRSGKSNSYQETFFEVGFRSKSTALRNFRELTGNIPSAYFSRNI